MSPPRRSRVPWASRATSVKRERCCKRPWLAWSPRTSHIEAHATPGRPCGAAFGCCFDAGGAGGGVGGSAGPSLPRRLLLSLTEPLLETVPLQCGRCRGVWLLIPVSRDVCGLSCAGAASIWRCLQMHDGGWSRPYLVRTSHAACSRSMRDMAAAVLCC